MLAARLAFAPDPLAVPSLKIDARSVVFSVGPQVYPRFYGWRAAYSVWKEPVREAKDSFKANDEHQPAKHRRECAFDSHERRDEPGDELCGVCDGRAKAGRV